MPQLSSSDCEELLRVLEEHPLSSSDALHAAVRLRQQLEQAVASTATFDRMLEPKPMPRASGGTVGSCTLHVCISCRPPVTPREPQESRPRFELYRELCAMLAERSLEHHVEVRPAQCLSLCPRPCGIALSSTGAWSYLFGDQQPGVTAADILECVSAYVASEDGHMPRARRPKTLRASILGRVPPFEGGQ